MDGDLVACMQDSSCNRCFKLCPYPHLFTGHFFFSVTRLSYRRGTVRQQHITLEVKKINYLQLDWTNAQIFIFKNLHFAFFRHI